MTDLTFDILAGPQGGRATVARPDRRERPIGFITFSVVAVLTVVGAVAVFLREPMAVPAVIAGGLLLGIVAGLTASMLARRTRDRRTWLESEIEIAWFRSLNANDDSDVDRDIWESSFSQESRSDKVGDYERGFREGYRRGTIDAA